MHTLASVSELCTSGNQRIPWKINLFRADFSRSLTSRCFSFSCNASSFLCSFSYQSITTGEDVLIYAVVVKPDMRT